MAEPVTVDEVKARLGVRSNHRDEEIAGLIPAARQVVEKLSLRILTRRVVTEYFPAFPCGFRRPLVLTQQPIISVDAVKYYDADLAEQDIADFRALPAGSIVRVFPPLAGNAWPAAMSDNDAAVSVTFTAGYDPAAEPDSDEGIPSALLQAMFLLIGHWFENHEAVALATIATEVPLGVRDICWNFRDDPGIS